MISKICFTNYCLRSIVILYENLIMLYKCQWLFQMDTFVRMSRALLNVPFLYALSAPYSVLRTLCRRFMSIIFFQHQAAAHALVSRRSVFFCFLLAIILLALCAFDLFSFSFTCLFHHHFHSLHDCPLSTVLCYSACAYICVNVCNVYVPPTLTCLCCVYCCSCCCGCL